MVEPTHLKNISQNRNLPQIGVKMKNILQPPASWLFLQKVVILAPWKNNMEPKIHPFRKGTSSEPNLHDFGFKMWIFKGETLWFSGFLDLSHELPQPKFTTRVASYHMINIYITASCHPGWSTWSQPKSWGVWQDSNDYPFAFRWFVGNQNANFQGPIIHLNWGSTNHQPKSTPLYPCL